MVIMFCSVLLCSAGVTDIIEVFLSLRGLFSSDSSKCQIVSNRMIWDDDGLLTGFEEPIVHSGNKAHLCERVADTLHHE